MSLQDDYIIAQGAMTQLPGRQASRLLDEAKSNAAGPEIEAMALMLQRAIPHVGRIKALDIIFALALYLDEAA